MGNEPMSILPFALDVLGGLTECNMHLTLYSAFGAILLVRAYLAARNQKHEAAREDAVIGLVHILLSLT